MTDLLPTVQGDAGAVEATPVVLVRFDGSFYEAGNAASAAVASSIGGDSGRRFPLPVVLVTPSGVIYEL